MDDVAFEGELSGLSFVDVLQLAVSKRERLKVEVYDAVQLFGEVYLDGPTLIGARVDSLSGIQALAALLRLTEGRFRVVHDEIERTGTLNRSLDVALFECAGLEDTEHDESRATLASEPPVDR